MITILYLSVFFCGNFTSGWQECKSNFGRQQFSKYQFDFELKGFQRNFGRKAFILSYRLERTNCSTEFHDSRSFHLDAVHIIFQPFDLFEKKKFPAVWVHARGLGPRSLRQPLLSPRQSSTHQPSSYFLPERENPSAQSPRRNAPWVWGRARLQSPFSSAYFQTGMEERRVGGGAVAPPPRLGEPAR